MDTLELLEQKINKAVALIEKLTAENEVLMEENKILKGKVSEMGSQLADAEKNNQNKSAQVKDKLNNILDKLGALEKI